MASYYNGILLLDKPIGLTSNQALTEVKNLFKVKKAGHTGSLDPLATGMLPICFGEATKFSQFLLEANKYYYVEVQLGIRTATGDAEGKIISRKEVQNITPALLEKTLSAFRGEIQQIPSMYSAIKYKGKPLYAYARQGIEIERLSRKVYIYEIDLLDCADAQFAISVKCSKGTYIRTLVDDIGEVLACGAYVTGLRRIFVEPYDESSMISLDDLKKVADGQQEIGLDNLLLPIDSALISWPEIHLPESVAHYIKQGQPVIVPQTPASGKVRLISQNKFFGIGEVLDDGRVAPRRLIV